MNPLVVQHVFDDDVRFLLVHIGDDALTGHRPLGKVGLAQPVGGAQFHFLGFKIQYPQEGAPGAKGLGNGPTGQLQNIVDIGAGMHQVADFPEGLIENWNFLG